MKIRGFMKYLIVMALFVLSACTGGEITRVEQPGDKICDAGTCVCPDGFTDCGDFSCVDLNTSRNHCGECGNSIDDHPGAGMCIGGEAMCTNLIPECEATGANTVCRLERDAENIVWTGDPECREPLSPECGDGMADDVCGTGRICINQFCTLNE